MPHRPLPRFALAALALAAATTAAHAGVPVPAYSSRPGAPYTLYLNFGGFSFNGTWGTTGKSPGVVPAYSTDADASVFSTAELSNLRQVWARVAEKYAPLNINVTTVDPAVAANAASTDAARQAYYDATPRLMHTVIGGLDDWYGSAGGVSYVGVISTPQPAGRHTNWVFPNSSPTNLRYLAEAAAHENGHAFSLSHQGDYGDGTNISSGSIKIRDYSTNGGVTGNGSYAPTMGVSYSSQRGLWRVGTAVGGSKFTQNDFTALGSRSGIALVDSGNGHSPASASELPLTPARATDPALARGVITPTTLSNPNPIGVANYTRDYFRFFSTGASFTLKLVAGSQYITPGAADPGATFDGTLKFYDPAGTLVATATRSSDTLSNTFTGTLPPGNYTAEIASIGGYTSSFDPNALYFTPGSYFLTGSSLYVRSNLVGVSLASANLTAQNLSASNLTSANLTSATLTGADLTSADLSLADLRNATGFAPAASTLTRGTLRPDGTVAAFTFTPGETLRVRANPSTPATATGTLAGPASATVSLDAGATLALSPSASARALDGPALALAGTSTSPATVRVTPTTATSAGRTAPPVLTHLASLSVTGNTSPLGSRLYYGLLDLGTNDALIDAGTTSLATLRDLARAYLTTNGTRGLGSSSALPYTRLAILPNDTSLLSGNPTPSGLAYFSTFDGLPASSADLLVRFTYLGDTDLSGTLDGLDLANLLEGLTSARTGWQYGDLNYDGTVNTTDLTLFNTAYAALQSAPSLGSPSDYTPSPGGGAVPEPACLPLAAGLVPLLTRRRR